MWRLCIQVHYSDFLCPSFHIHIHSQARADSSGDMGAGCHQPIVGWSANVGEACWEHSWLAPWQPDCRGVLAHLDQHPEIWWLERWSPPRKYHQDYDDLGGLDWAKACGIRFRLVRAMFALSCLINEKLETRLDWQIQFSEIMSHDWLVMMMSVIDKTCQVHVTRTAVKRHLRLAVPWQFLSLWRTQRIMKTSWPQFASFARCWRRSLPRHEQISIPSFQQSSRHFRSRMIRKRQSDSVSWHVQNNKQCLYWIALAKPSSFILSAVEFGSDFVCACFSEEYPIQTKTTTETVYNCTLFIRLRLLLCRRYSKTPTQRQVTRIPGFS